MDQFMSNTQTSASFPQSTDIRWDCGSAYDLFVSLKVLHEPSTFGLRASWAAGVRSRLPLEERKFLEEIYSFFWVPITWIYNLPEPKDAATALSALRQIPAERRLVTLSYALKETPSEMRELIQKVNSSRGWDDSDLEKVRAMEKTEGHNLTTSQLKSILNWLSKADEFGEKLLEALQTYHQVFFAEEEHRIEQPLHQALQKAQQFSQTLPPMQLLNELSQGVEFEESFFKKSLILAPTYWSTPFIFLADLNLQTKIVLFGARPTGDSLIPGEQVPETLLIALKALADPTRLGILRYLEQAPHTPSQLARKLRLRAPTVTHHLNELRLAGLVQISIRGEMRYYSARHDYLKSLGNSLEQFLHSQEPSSRE